MSDISGLPMDRFVEVDEGRRKYHLDRPRPALFESPIERELAEHGIATIEMPLTPGDFQALLDGFAVCIGECPDLLADTYHQVDGRFGNEAGHTRKERKFTSAGIQSQDPKHLMHFNEYARARWGEQFANGPKVLRDFLADGYEIHNALIALGRDVFEQLENSHPNIQGAHYPGLPGTAHASQSFVRVIRYDSYTVNEDLGPVAKPHFDIGGATIQAYADAEGFWGAPDGKDGEHIPYDTDDDKAYFFMGRGYEKLYGLDALYRPLYHGVDRIVPAGATIVPERHAVILFIDSPFINYGVKPEDTLPEIYGAEQATA